MFEFLKLNAIISVLKFIGLYIALTLIPVLLIFWYKRQTCPAGTVRLLNDCIRHGGTLTWEQCQKTYELIREIRSVFDRFRHQDGVTLPGQVSLAEAINLLPLLVEIGQPQTCCRQPVYAAHQHLERNFDCKLAVNRLIEELSRDTQTPVISEELVRIAQVRQRIKTAQRRRRIWTWLFMSSYGLGCYLLTITILAKKNQLAIGLIFYGGAMFPFLYRCDYYYSQIYRRYQAKEGKTKKTSVNLTKSLTNN